MIKPTVGRVVLFTPSVSNDPRSDKSQPIPALITYVWGDRCVNLGGFDQNGNPVSGSSVTLLQDGEAPLTFGHYCEWMPYQKGQAAKTESLEAQLAARNIPENIPAPPAAVSSPEVPVPPGGFGYLEETLRARAVAPRVSLQDLEAEIAAEYWFTGDKVIAALDAPSSPELALLSIWIGVTRDGFTLVGKSAPASPANFDAEIGRQFAREDGMRQLWPLMGFRLRSHLATEAKLGVVPTNPSAPFGSLERYGAVGDKDLSGT